MVGRNHRLLGEKFNELFGVFRRGVALIIGLTAFEKFETF